MIPARFDYAAPESPAAAVGLLAGDDARVLAGGTWVVPELQAGASRTALVVDLVWPRVVSSPAGQRPTRTTRAA